MAQLDSVMCNGSLGLSGKPVAESERHNGKREKAKGKRKKHNHCGRLRPSEMSLELVWDCSETERGEKCVGGCGVPVKVETGGFSTEEGGCREPGMG